MTIRQQLFGIIATAAWLALTAYLVTLLGPIGPQGEITLVQGAVVLGCIAAYIGVVLLWALKKVKEETANATE